MPTMIRPNNHKTMRQGKHIAFNILGVPPNMQKQKDKYPFDKHTQNRLLAEETTRVR